MKTHGSLVGLVALVAATASLTTGCLFGCDPANNSQRAPIDFTPSSVTAFRTPSACGVTDPAFTGTDAFALELTGETDIAPPFTTITLDLTPSVATNEPTPLTVSQSSSNVTSGSSEGMHFSYAVGSNAAELDANALVSVVVTVTSFPSADGQPLSAELQLMFADGRSLDQIYTAPVQSVFVPCAGNPASHLASQ